jgi:hypothetical protein
MYKIVFTGKLPSFGKPVKGITAMKIPNANIVEIFTMAIY